MSKPVSALLEFGQIHSHRKRLAGQTLTLTSWMTTRRSCQAWRVSGHYGDLIDPKDKGVIQAVKRDTLTKTETFTNFIDKSNENENNR